MAAKGKEKADSCTSSICDDSGLKMERAHEVVTSEELKVFFGMPSNELVGRHIHKLVQVMCSCNFILFFVLLFRIVLKTSIFFLGVGGESSYHLRVSYLGG